MTKTLIEPAELRKKSKIVTSFHNIGKSVSIDICATDSASGRKLNPVRLLLNFELPVVGAKSIDARTRLKEIPSAKVYS